MFVKRGKRGFRLRIDIRMDGGGRAKVPERYFGGVHAVKGLSRALATSLIGIVNRGAISDTRSDNDGRYRETLNLLRGRTYVHGPCPSV